MATNRQELKATVDNLLKGLANDPEATRELIVAILSKLDGRVPSDIVTVADLKHVANSIVTERDVHEARERLPFGTRLYCHRDLAYPRSADQWIGQVEECRTDPLYTDALKIMMNGKEGSLVQRDWNAPVKGAQGKTLFFMPIPKEEIESIRIGTTDEETPFVRDAIWIETNAGRTFHFDPKHPVNPNDVKSDRKPYMTVRGGALRESGYKLFHYWDWEREEWHAEQDKQEQDKIAMGSYPDMHPYQEPAPYRLEERVTR